MFPVSAPVLSFELLDALQDRWVRGEAADLVSHLEPGLSDERIDELTSPLGLRLPPELRTWFAWRNGAQHREWTCSLDLWSLATSVAETQLRRDTNLRVRRNPEAAEESEFQPSWFMFSGGDGSGAYVDTADRRPMSHLYYWDPEQPPVDTGIPSLGRLVEIAIEAWDCGWYVRWEPGGWVIDDTRQLDVARHLI